MALSIPKAGFARFLKEGAKHYQGIEEAVIRNIEACTEMANTVRSAFGPNGMNKMVINHIEKLFVTNDAATIIKELEVQHPAAKMLVLASQMQEAEIGDSTNFVLIFAGALLEHAEELLRMGLTPVEISEGYERALKKALTILPDLSCGKVEDLRNVEKVQYAIRSSVMSKQFGTEDFLANLIAEACVAVVPKNVQSFNVDNIRICKILGSGILSSRVMHGMVFKKSSEGDVKKVDKAKLAMFTCPFDVTQTETKGTVLIHTAKELLDYSQGEEDVVEAQVKAMVDAGVNVVVAGGKFGDLHLHFLNKYKIMAVRLTSKFDLRRLCRSVGATALPRITAPTKDELGTCDHVYVDEVGDTEVVVFKQDGEQGNVATLILRGATENLMDDIERAVDDGINTYKTLTKDNRLLAGAGAVEIELAKQIEQYGAVCPGMEQYAIEKFAQALESLPKVLADNAGAKTTEILSKLYAAHQDGHKFVGFDNTVDGGGVKNAADAGIVDTYLGKYWALKLATNAAATVLKVDQIIMAKQVTGPKPGSKPADEDD